MGDTNVVVTGGCGFIGTNLVFELLRRGANVTVLDLPSADWSRFPEGIKTIKARPVNGRLPTTGPITFGRGVEITLTCDDGAFEGVGSFLLGLVLQEFFAKYVSINSFTSTVLRSSERGEVMRWSPNLGRVQTL